jgi:hypothetical protein
MSPSIATQKPCQHDGDIQTVTHNRRAKQKRHGI